MEEFIETVVDAKLKETLERALIRPRPFWNFKFESDNPALFGNDGLNSRKMAQITTKGYLC